MKDTTFEKMWLAVILFTLVALIITPSESCAAEHAENITLPKESIVRIQQLIVKQAQQADGLRGEVAYWSSEFVKVKDCVRASKTHAEALVCIGDIQS